MNFQELKKQAKSWSGVVLLESSVPLKSRRTIEEIVFWLILLIVLADAFKLIPTSINLISLVIIGICIMAIIFFFDAYFYSFYFKGNRFLLPEIGIGEYKKEEISYEVAMIILASNGKDLTKDFFNSLYGKDILKRLNINKSIVDEFFKERKNPLEISRLNLDIEDGINLENLAIYIFKNDAELRNFLFQNQVQNNDFAGASGFVARFYNREKRHTRWWGRDNLGKIPGIGRDWSYGKTFILRKYGADLSESIGENSLSDSNFAFENNEEIQVETILARSFGSNVLLVGEGDERKLSVVEYLTRKILHGGVFPTLEDKHVVILDTNALIASNGDKISFENEFLRLLKEANKAGNIILVIKDLPVFMSSALSLGSDLIDLIDPYLRSSDIQIIAFADPSAYHSILEKNERVMERFEKVSLKESTSENLTLVLENQVYDLEKTYGVFFTYGAMEAIVISADRYFTDGVEADKVSDLAIEIIPEIIRLKKRIILREDILSLVGTKTGIPIGEISTVEKQKLLNLESVLHERIIGQDEAIKAISNAMRRARSGIGNPNRPMGSFLFLGPTGVGKTETTKALADVFFGKTDTIMRLDMSEYNSDGALDKLIGSFAGGKSGVLTSMLREKPYGVLLLDEFEKTEKKVHDLFLQILDEGIFSDMLGKKVNARNTIIIATSNAGSDLIWEIVKKGGDLEKSKDEIIDTIVRNGIFKPELLNRFDGVILFHPLLTEDLKKVARLMLGKLEKRLGEKGLELQVNDDLINYLVEVGSDPKFGARPINRAIQETVEKVIADKMLAGTISAGSKISLSKEELRKV